MKDELSTEEIEEMLRVAVAVGPWPVQALREILLGRCTGYQLRQAVSSCTRRGEIVVFRPTFWASPAFVNDERRKSGTYVAENSREQLIARLSARARPPEPARDSVADLMQGDDADRLAREAFERHGD